MIEVFKIIHNMYDAKVSPQLMLNERANTRGNKLLNHTFHYNLRKHFFFCTYCKYMEQFAKFCCRSLLCECI